MPKPKPSEVSREPSLWDDARREIKKRGGQAARILARLQAGPATSLELAQVALKYTNRISELREAGHTIQAEQVDGLWRYTLTSAAQ